MSVQRRVFPESFKREAVDRVANSGLSAGAVARELGLHETVLCGWHEGRATGLGETAVMALRAAGVPGAGTLDPSAAPVEADEAPPALESLPWRTAIATRFADSDARRMASDNFIARCAEQVRVEFLGQTFGSRERRGASLGAHGNSGEP